MLGDVNISGTLDSFSVNYDKRVRPNYGSEYLPHPLSLTHSLFPVLHLLSCLQSINLHMDYSDDENVMKDYNLFYDNKFYTKKL